MTMNVPFPVIAKLICHLFTALVGASLVAYMVESSCSCGRPGSIPESGRRPGEGNGIPLQYLAWKIPWTEEPGGLQSTEVTNSRTRPSFELAFVESFACPPFLGALALDAGFLSLS